MLEGAYNPHAFDYWYEALRAKYAGKGKPYQRAEFDKVLGNYSVRNLLSWLPSFRALKLDTWIMLSYLSQLGCHGHSLHHVC